MRIGAREDAELRRRHGQRPAPAQGIIEIHAERGRAANGIRLVQGLHALTLVDQAQSADGRAGWRRRPGLSSTGVMPCDCDRCAAGPMPESMQDLRRADRAGRQDDFAAALAVRAAPPWRNATPMAACRRRVSRSTRQPVSSFRFDPVQHRLEESARRRPAPAAPLGDVEIAHEPSLSPLLKSLILAMPDCSAASRNASRMSQRTRGASTRHSPPSA